MHRIRRTPELDINAPFHKFRWLHVPGKDHQGRNPFRGTYTYTVTARFFDANASLEPLDPAWSVSVDAEVVPFELEGLAVSFTRGYVQSQAFVHHFGVDGEIVPPDGSTLLSTPPPKPGRSRGRRTRSPTSGHGQGSRPVSGSSRCSRRWWTTRRSASTCSPTTWTSPTSCGRSSPSQRRRGSASSWTTRASTTLRRTRPRTSSSELFRAARADNGTRILRGHFNRFAHDKIMIVREGGERYAAGDTVRAVLTGSTNFSVTGMYVNANHVIVLDAAQSPAHAPVAAQYAEVFEEIWNANVKVGAFETSGVAGQAFSFDTPPMEITFAPHPKAFATQNLAVLAARIEAEAAKQQGGSVLFAVMSIRDPATAAGSTAAAGPSDNTNPVYAALKAVHEDEKIVSYGVTDDTAGSRCQAGKQDGVLVSGLPGQTQLPPPFDQVPTMKWHQIHHKFVVCGFNGDDPVVYCGSSNLAEGGERVNGDNLLAIRDEDVATVFAIEALALVDHFETLDSHEQPPAGAAPPAQPRSSFPFEFTTADWAKEFFDPHDLHYADRLLFA